MPITRQQFAVNLLQSLGIQPNSQNVPAIIAWEQAEGSNAANNPLDTSLTWPGSYPLPGNRDNVQQYPSYQAGVQATAATLQEPRYASIDNALAHGSYAQIIQAIGSSHWGTNPQTLAEVAGTPLANTSINGGVPSTPTNIKWYEPWTWGSAVSNIAWEVGVGALGVLLILLGLNIALKGDISVSVSPVKAGAVLS